MKNLLLIAIAILGFSAVSFGQSVSATASASATIVTPLAISKTVDLNFGNVAVNNTLGTVILTPAGGRSVTGGVSLSSANAGAVAAASFTVTGVSGYTYAITLPTTATDVAYLSNHMSVNAFTSTPTPTGTLTGGSETINVGATLNVGANQAAGLYTSGTPFTVTVNYN